MGFDPSVDTEWKNDDVRKALDAIQGPCEGKKRTTVILVAFAMANESPFNSVFKRKDTCSRAIWYGQVRRNGRHKLGWREIPEVAAAVDICKRRALDWRDEQTARIEAYYRSIRLRSVAELAAQAPEALATVMKDSEQRGSDRIKAANDLLSWADPEAAGKVRPVASIEQDVNLNLESWRQAREGRLQQVAELEPIGD